MRGADVPEMKRMGWAGVCVHGKGSQGKESAKDVRQVP